MSEYVLQDKIGYLVRSSIKEVAAEEGGNANVAWSKAEDEYLKANLGFMTDAEIGAALGRTEVAVLIHRKRELRLPAPSKHPDYVTASVAGRMLGVDSHKTANWVDRGILPGHRMAGDRVIRRIKRLHLDLFVVNPKNWIWFDPTGIVDKRLHRLAALAMQRWGDEWWTTGQAADYCGLAGPKSALLAIMRGALPAVQTPSLGGRTEDPSWSNWFLKRSDVVAWQQKREQGTKRRDRFLLEATAAGLHFEYIARLVGYASGYSVQMRLASLFEAGEVAGLAADVTGLQFRAADQVLWLDWRSRRGRFPRLDGAIDRAVVGGANQQDWIILRGLVRNWCLWHLGREDELTQTLFGGGLWVESQVRQVLKKLARRGIQVLDGIPPRSMKRSP